MNADQARELTDDPKHSQVYLEHKINQTFKDIKFACCEHNYFVWVFILEKHYKYIKDDFKKHFESLGYDVKMPTWGWRKYHCRISWMKK